MSGKQCTIARDVKFAGVALHDGSVVNVHLLPAAENTGVVFRRVDKNAEFSPDCRLVADTFLATTLCADGVRVGMVEHLLSAVAAMRVDNLIVALDGVEVPVVDGSAAPWCLLLSACGKREQRALRRRIRVKKKVGVEEGKRRASLSPPSGEMPRYDVTIDYPHAVVSNSGTRFSFTLEAAAYRREISRARTFCYVNDVEQMHRHRRARGGSLQNAVVYDDHGVINKGGLRYPDEFVRHKVLDAIGDCFINGYLVAGDYCGDSPGHDLNNRLMRTLMDDDTAWEWSG